MMIEELVPLKKSLKITDKWRGLTLLEAVRRAFPELTARDVFKDLRTGKIDLNGKRCEPLTRLDEGDFVNVTLMRPPKAVSKPVLKSDQRIETPAGPFHIVREDEDLLAVSKPPGCASHPALGHSQDTLIDRVRHYLGPSSEEDFNQALANRLDIETSGLVLIAKNKHAQRKLGFLIQKKRIEKRYLALVAGWPDRDKGEIDLPLERRPDSRDIAKYPPGHHRLSGRIQEALTLYTVLERFENPLAATLVEVELVTGRNHQIRRHFADAGHPVALDKRYGDKGFNYEVEEVTGLWRMFLHAWKMVLPHPVTREKIELTAPLPEDLRGALKSFGCSFKE